MELPAIAFGPDVPLARGLQALERGTTEDLTADLVPGLQTLLFCKIRRKEPRMGFVEDTLAVPRPDALAALDLPRRQSYHPSPDSWQDEVVYFLLVDRFSDGAESNRPLLDRTKLGASRPAQANGEPWRWDIWALSGSDRYQGGTLAGVTSKLEYPRSPGRHDGLAEPSLSAARSSRQLPRLRGTGLS